MQSLLHAGTGGLLQSLYYSYDDDGRRTKIVREDGTGIYYRYDAAGRLTGEDWLDGSGQGLYAFDYRFDAAGNRTQLTKNGETTYYEYNTLNQ
ncbi:MAG: RHS repeat domain-containing protein, partial [Armatimonadia bacterium]